MKVHLRKRKLKKSSKSKPRYTLYLDIYYHKGKRKREFLNIYLEPQDTQTSRKEKLELAHNIKAQRMLELTNEEYGFSSRHKLKMNFIEYFEIQMNKRNGKTKLSWESSYRHLYRYTNGSIIFADINKNWLKEFTEYLLTKVSINSAYLYISKIRCALNEAVKDGFIRESPSRQLSPLKVPQSFKEYLTLEEMQKIANTKLNGCAKLHFNEIRKAFLFACYTGLRLSDIRKLKWYNIRKTSFEGSGIRYIISFQQTKTKIVNTIPLNEVALKIISPIQNNDSLVFHLYKYNDTIGYALKKILVSAKISKKITFHSSRHTYAIMLLANGTNLMTVKELLGHHDIKSTMIYAKVVDASKNKAVNQLPTINL